MTGSRRAMTVAAGLRMTVVAMLLVACTGRSDAPPPQLTVASTSEGMLAHMASAYAQGATDHWGVDVNVVHTSGTVASLEQVNDGLAAVAFVPVDVAAIAQMGAHPFGQALDLRALARLCDDYLHIVTLASTTHITEITDLDGKVVAIGPHGHGSDIAAERVLHVKGVEPAQRVHLTPDRAVTALQLGQVDAIVIPGGIPMPEIADLARRMEIRFLSMSHHVTELRNQFGDYYLEASIPVGLYGTTQGVGTVSVPIVAVVRADLAPDIAFGLTELLFNAKDQLVAAHEEMRSLNHRSALTTMPIELHVGSLQYYREHKPMVE
jgi:TRAP transporter TAXI family solute receptor